MSESESFHDTWVRLVREASDAASKMTDESPDCSSEDKDKLWVSLLESAVTIVKFMCAATPEERGQLRCPRDLPLARSEIWEDQSYGKIFDYLKDKFSWEGSPEAYALLCERASECLECISESSESVTPLHTKSQQDAKTPEESSDSL